MLIVIPATEANPDAPVDVRFGRAAQFIVWETDTDEWHAVDNIQNLEAAQGAGIQAARTIVETGAKALLSGSVGPKAFRTLEAGGVAVHVGAAGTVRETVARFKEGDWPASDAANAESHWV